MTNIIKSTACIISDPRVPISWLDENRPLNQRASEAGVVELEDGRLLLVYSHYYGGGGDHDPSDIRGKISSDGGKTWSDASVIQQNDARLNVMSASLVRMKPVKGIDPGCVSRHDRGVGPIGLLYLKNQVPNRGQIVFRTSADEGQYWSQEAIISPQEPSPTMSVLNSSVRVLSCGRIVVPFYSATAGLCWSSVLYSDDSGFVWQRSCSELSVELGQGVGQSCFVEPCIAESRDGRLIMVGRTITGRIWKSVSDDRGTTWSKAEPMDLAASGSPAIIERIPSTGDLMIVWNQASTEEIDMGLGRSRLSVAISKDDGESWQHFKNLESLDDRTQIEPPELGSVSADNSEQVAIQIRTRSAELDVEQECSPEEKNDLSAYPYAGNSDKRGYQVAEYPSLSFISHDRVVITYDAAGGEWNYGGAKAHCNEGPWTNKEKLPGLNVQVIPLEWLYS